MFVTDPGAHDAMCRAIDTAYEVDEVKRAVAEPGAFHHADALDRRVDLAAGSATLGG